MNKNVLFATAAAGLVALAAAAAPAPATAAPEAGVLLLALEVRDQQKSMAGNQTRIEERTAQIAEELRLARIFAARSGGRSKTP